MLVFWAVSCPGEPQNGKKVKICKDPVFRGVSGSQQQNIQKTVYIYIREIDSQMVSNEQNIWNWMGFCENHWKSAGICGNTRKQVVKNLYNTGVLGGCRPWGSPEWWKYVKMWGFGTSGGPKTKICRKQYIYTRDLERNDVKIYENKWKCMIFYENPKKIYCKIPL